MAPVLGVKIQILLDDVDLSQDSFSVSGSAGRPEQEANAYQTTARQYQPGAYRGTLSHRGYLSGKTVTDIASLFEDRASGGQTGLVGVALGTNTPGCPVYFVEDVSYQNVTWDLPITELLNIESSLSENQDVLRGIRLASGTFAAIGAQSQRDLGAQSTDGGKLVIWLTDIEGTPTGAIDVDLEHSAVSGSGFSAKATAALNAVGGHVVDFSGTLERYVRINLTDLAGATGVTLFAAVYAPGTTHGG